MAKRVSKPFIVTTSSMTTLFDCPRRYYLSYKMGYRKTIAADALRFGTAFHKGLESWFLGKSEEECYVDAISTAGCEKFSAVTEAKIRATLIHYFKRWQSERTAFSVEPEREFAVRCPWRRNVLLCGKVDGIVTYPDGRKAIIEHKSVSATKDISPFSDYWNDIDMRQIRLYKACIRKAFNIEPESVIYDVCRKCGDPKLATPEDKRKYTKDGKLYANMRAEDETADEYFDRINAEMGADPDKFFQRKEILLAECDIDELAADVDDMLIEAKAFTKQEERLDEQGMPRIWAWHKNGKSFKCAGCDFKGVCDETGELCGDWERGRAFEELEIVKKYI